MDSNITGRRQPPPPIEPPARSAILELGDQLEELWLRFRAVSDAFELADEQRAEFAAANIPAALTQKPGDAGLFHPAFYPGIGLFYLDEAIDRLGEALMRPGCKASVIARERVHNMLESREAWRKTLEGFESSVGLGEIRRAYDEAFNDLFGALNRLRDMPATTLDELRVKARQWNELAGAGHNARAWNIEAERPDDDDCMMGSILSDLIGNIGPSGPGSAETWTLFRFKASELQRVCSSSPFFGTSHYVTFCFFFFDTINIQLKTPIVKYFSELNERQKEQGHVWE